MEARSDIEAQTTADARRARLRRLASLTPAQRLERLDALNRQLTRLRADARGSRTKR
ncbi:MAG: hypothetical protein ACHQJ5_11010 [Vicinamibacteria bacterium]|jgi:hypothetical protein